MKGTRIATWYDWVYSEWVLHVWITSSITDTQNNTFFDERLSGSNASCSNRCIIWFVVWSLIWSLVGLHVGSLVGIFVGLLIGSSNWITWLIQPWAPATKLRLVNAFAWLTKRKSAKSTKNLERTVVAVQSFAFQCFNYFFKRSQFLFCLCNLAKTWVW